MRVLIFVSCALAYTSAAYLGPQHIPVIGPNGVPVEPIEVQAERGRHLATLAASRGLLGHLGVPAFHHNALPLDTAEVAAAKVQHYRDYAVAAQRNGVHNPLHAALLSAHSVHPIDTPEVQLAKAAHFAAHAEAAARNGGYVHFRRKRDVYGGYHIPVIGPNGVPVEPPEVQAARANHLAALGQAATRSAPVYSGYYEPAPAAAYAAPHSYDGPRYYGPPAQIGHDGQPVETPEVKAAKSYHFAAHAALRTGHYGHF